jgi:RimJ/RimL family protein N-acetyltransferase
MRPDPASGVVEIGGVLHARPVQRTPATTETIPLLLQHAFDDLGNRRVEWKCDHLNEPSRAAARRLGFSYEGRFRQHLVVKGRNRDTDWFAIVDRDWPAVRRALEAWLGPDNFDGAGRQRVALGTLTSPLLA